MINWHAVSASDEEKIVRIVERAYVVLYGRRFRRPIAPGVMDLVACHGSGCPLDLDRLLEASDFDLAHDVAGITRHIDRETGELRDCFLPRFTRR